MQSSLFLEESCRRVLKETYGYDDFRPHQLEVLMGVLSGQNALVVMGTGSGKSLCYQIPPLVTHRPAIIISPLISLMNDQVENLRRLGVDAIALHSQSTAPRNMTTATHIFISPERFEMTIDSVMQLFRTRGLSCFGVDESHCIADWGHDFRPAYNQLGKIKEYFPTVPVVAVTATATMKVRNQIMNKLGMLPNCVVRIGSFDRPNLSYHFIEKASSILVDLKPKYFSKGPTIIYCLRREECETIARILMNGKVSALPYHAKLPPRKRIAAETKFRNGEIRCIVATIAFGMGIDKPDVRCVLHYGMPKSIEDYHQQTGRAGRDGLPSQCILLWKPRDFAVGQYFVEQTSTPFGKQVAANLLRQMKGLVYTRRCRRAMILHHFGETIASAESSCHGCDICLMKDEAHARGEELDELKEVDFTEEARAVVTAVWETGERFGSGVPMDVVRGVESSKLKQKFCVQVACAVFVRVTARGHRRFRIDYHMMKSWGKLKSKQMKFVKGLFRTLIDRQVLQTVRKDGWALTKIGPEGRQLYTNPSYRLAPWVPDADLMERPKIRRSSSKAGTLPGEEPQSVSMLSQYKYCPKKKQKQPDATPQSAKVSARRRGNTRPSPFQFSAAECSPRKTIVPPPPERRVSKKRSAQEAFAGSDRPAKKRRIEPEMKRVRLVWKEDSNDNVPDQSMTFIQLGGQDGDDKENKDESFVNLNAPLDEKEEQLKEFAMKLRQKIAQKTGMKPYDVVSNAALDGLVRFRPSSVENLARVPRAQRVCEKNRKQFGKLLSTKVKQMCNKLGLTTDRGLVDEEDLSALGDMSLDQKEPDVSVNSPVFAPEPKKRSLCITLPQMTSDLERTWKMFSTGKSVSEISTARTIRREKVLNHLCDLCLMGRDIDWSRLKIEREAYQNVFIILSLESLDLPPHLIREKSMCHDLTDAQIGCIVARYIHDHMEAVDFNSDDEVEDEETMDNENEDVDDFDSEMYDGSPPQDDNATQDTCEVDSASICTLLSQRGGLTENDIVQSLGLGADLSQRQVLSQTLLQLRSDFVVYCDGDKYLML